MLMKEGYSRRITDMIQVENEMNMERWRQTRFIAYSMAKPYLKDQNLTIYEFMQLPGDPTGEEIKQEGEKGLDTKALEVIEYYTKNGWLKPTA